MSLKEVLNQYTAVKKEREYIAEKVMALERQIERMEQSGYSVKDTVRGGEGNMHIRRLQPPQDTSESKKAAVD